MEAVIVDCLRTAIGKAPKGTLRNNAARRSGRGRIRRAYSNNTRRFREIRWMT